MLFVPLVFIFCNANIIHCKGGRIILTWWKKMGHGGNMEIAFCVILTAGSKFYLNSRGWLVKAAMDHWIRLKILKP